MASMAVTRYLLQLHPPGKAVPKPECRCSPSYLPFTELFAHGGCSMASW